MTIGTPLPVVNRAEERTPWGRRSTKALFQLFAGAGGGMGQPSPSLLGSGYVAVTKYIGFTKSIIFILGLILSYKMAEKKFLNILITRLTIVSEMQDLRRSVLIVNLHQGISGVFVVVFAKIAHGYTGLFWTVVLSTIACISGLTLDLLSARNDDKGQLDLQLFYPALVLMGLAQAAQTVTLQAFLDYQFTTVANYDEKMRQRSTKFWWILISSVAAILNQLDSLNRFHFKKLVPVLITVIGCFFIVFLLGLPCYDYEKRMRGNDVVEEVQRKTLEVEPVNLMSLCVCMFILSLVYASGSTLFLLEASTLDDCNSLAAILLLDNLVRSTEFVVSELSSLVLKKLRQEKRYSLQKMELLRIGIGMWCCMLCCNFAMGTTTRRKNDAGGDKMSVYWLMPQFTLLGLMGGLAKDGFQSLYESQAPPESAYRYGSPIGELAKGAGALLSMLCIFIFSRRHFEWFQNNLDSSSLDKYYYFLAILSAGSLLLYYLVAFSYLGVPLIQQEDIAPTEKKIIGSHGSTEAAIGSHAPTDTAIDIPEETTIDSHAPNKTVIGSHEETGPVRRAPKTRGHAPKSILSGHEYE